MAHKTTSSNLDDEQIAQSSSSSKKDEMNDMTSINMGAPGTEVTQTDQVYEKTPDTGKVGLAVPSPPDGGKEAWLVTFGAFCALITSFGWLNSVGVFQDYYRFNYLQSYSSSDISWISSLQVSWIFSGGIVFGKLFDDNGPRWLLIVGTFLQFFGLIITSGSTQYYQFMLAQAICSSIGASAIYYAVAGSVATWFTTKRATAFGLAATGASLGGVIFPIMVTRLIGQIGYPWTMRIVAFILLALNVVAILTVKSFRTHTPKPFLPRRYVEQFTDLPFAALIAGMSIFSLGLWLPFNYLITQGQAAGMSYGLSQYLVSILNAASLFGRFLPGILGDKFGRINVLFVATFLSGILTLALWIPANNNATIIAYAAMYGFSSGAYVSLGPSVVMQVSDIKEIGLRNGVLYFVVGIAVLVGNPIGGQLLSTRNGDFVGLQSFAGATMIAGALFILLSRTLLVGSSWKIV